MRLKNKLSYGAQLMREGQAGFMVDTLKRRLWSDTLSFGLKRDLTVPFQAPDAKIALSVRPLRASERSLLSEVGAADAADRRERRTRQRVLDAGFGTCYAVVNDDDAVCYVQWIIESGDNDAVQEFYKGLFPVLAPGDVLLEGAYTFSEFRGLRVMANGMAQVAEVAADSGANSAITFVGVDNIASLKGCERSGFYPVVNHRDRRRLFHTEFMIDPIASTAPAQAAA